MLLKAWQHDIGVSMLGSIMFAKYISNRNDKKALIILLREVVFHGKAQLFFLKSSFRCGQLYELNYVNQEIFYCRYELSFQENK